jgi:prolyl-tRNA synthetase
VGEDAFVWCESCDYAANTEAATKQELRAGDPPEVDERERLHTPDLPGIDGVAAHLGIPPHQLLKCIAFDVDGELGLALLPGDREVNEFALDQAFAPAPVHLYTDADFAAHPELPKGYIGPDYAGAKHVIADSSVRAPHGWVTGANEPDHHVRNAVLGRDFTPTAWGDIAVVEPDDPCPRCGAPLRIDRGIEVGHVFQLGTKYTAALGAHYTDESGEQHPMVMGCYGIGVSRIIAAVVEEHHDDAGIAWPAALAPFDVHLIAMPGDESLAAANQLAGELAAAGVEVLFDDREMRPGPKFADADLLGMPVQVIVGSKGLARGVVERKHRATGERDEIAVADAVATLAGS